MQREVVVVGLNHHRAPVEIRERVTLNNGSLDAALQQVMSVAPIQEAVIVSTCNRAEVVAATAGGDAAVDGLATFFASRSTLPREDVLAHLSVHRGREAVRHLFRVGASLDSMVVGEPQILGQLKDSYHHAAAAGGAGVVLHRCFHKTFSVAKRVRTETGVAGKAVSVSAAAVELACKIFDRLEDKTAMLIGAGTMGELAARHLRARGIGNVMVTNRTFERAVELAREFRGTPVRFDEFHQYLPMADVVVGAAAADQYVLTPAVVQDVLRQRRHRPMFLVDVGVPRTFDPGLNGLDNVYLYDIDDLGAVAASNRNVRGREAEKAEVIVDQEVDAFSKWLAALDAVPTIVALREKVEAVRQAELAKTLATLRDLSPQGRESLDAMTAAIVNKILHAPLAHLKHHDGQQDGFCLAAIRRLFDIDEP